VKPSRLAPAAIAAVVAIAAAATAWLMLRRSEAPVVTPDASVALSTVDVDVDGDVDVDDPKPDAAPATIVPPSPPPIDRRDGFLSIDATPYATIYVDGKKLGVTPLLNKPLPPGRHKLRAVTEAGATHERTITIRPGKRAPPINLSW
jgi:hypothetical protein